MDTIYQHTNNPKIKIVEIMSELTGGAAARLQESTYTCLDEGECYMLINLKHVRKIDGLGIRVLEQLINRGVHVRLFNVGEDVRWMLMVSGKDRLFKVYNETDCHKVVSMFEKEGLEEDQSNDVIRKRHYSRIDTFFHADFKCHPGYNGPISGMARVMNLSEGGFLSWQIKVLNTENGETAYQPEIFGKTLYDIKFRLNGGPGFIETDGVCVREVKVNEQNCVGIRFDNMKQNYKEKIRDFVAATCVT